MQILVFLDTNMLVSPTQNCGVGGLSQHKDPTQILRRCTYAILSVQQSCEYNNYFLVLSMIVFNKYLGYVLLYLFIKDSIIY